MVHAVNEKPESLKGCNSSTITQEGDSHIKLFISLSGVKLACGMSPHLNIAKFQRNNTSLK